MGTSLPAIIRAGGRSLTGLQPLAWVSPTPLGVLRDQLPGAKGNPRARKFEAVRLILIGKVITKPGVSDGHGLNGRSSTRGGRRKALIRSPGSLEPGRRPRSRGRRAKPHRTRGPTGRTVGGGSLNGPNQRLSHVPSTSQMPRGYTPMHTRKGPTPLHIRYKRLFLPRGGWQFRRAWCAGMERA